MDRKYDFKREKLLFREATITNLLFNLIRIYSSKKFAETTAEISEEVRKKSHNYKSKLKKCVSRIRTEWPCL